MCVLVNIGSLWFLTGYYLSYFLLIFGYVSPHNNAVSCPCCRLSRLWTCWLWWDGHPSAISGYQSSGAIFFSFGFVFVEVLFTFLKWNVFVAQWFLSFLIRCSIIISSILCIHIHCLFVLLFLYRLMFSKPLKVETMTLRFSLSIHLSAFVYLIIQ